MKDLEKFESYPALDAVTDVTSSNSSKCIYSARKSARISADHHPRKLNITVRVNREKTSRENTKNPPYSQQKQTEKLSLRQKQDMLDKRIIALLSNSCTPLSAREIVDGIAPTPEDKLAVFGDRGCHNMETMARKVNRAFEDRLLAYANDEYQLEKVAVAIDGTETLRLSAADAAERVRCHLAQWKYRLALRTPSFDEQDFAFEDESVAMVLALTDRFLPGYLPSDHYQRFVNEVKPGNYGSKPGQLNRINRLMSGIAIMQRGHSLVAPSGIPFGLLDGIYSAVTDGLALTVCRTGEDTRLVYPLGVVFRDPKIYLVAQDLDDDRRRIRHYRLDRITSVKPVEYNGFKTPLSLHEYLASGAMLHRPEGLPRCEDVLFDVLPLRHADGQVEANDALQRDIQEYRLSNDQVSTLQADGTLQVSLPAMPLSTELVEYLAARLDRIRVKAPDSLRDHLVKRLRNALDLYEAP